MIAGIKKQHQEKVKKLTKEMVKVFARVDDDGFGYAAITRDGSIYGEKWLRKEDAFVTHSQPKVNLGNNLVATLLGEAAKFKDAPSEDKIYDQFGVPRTKEMLNTTVAVILHARKKTQGDKSIDNTHPFFQDVHENDPAAALIHNGSILNHLSLTKKTSTCDSETILHEYMKNAMFCNPWAMPTLSRTLVGQYTCGVLTSTTNEQGQSLPVMDIFKSNKDLFCAFVKEIETFVFCTAPWALEEAVKLAGMTTSGIAEVRDGYYLRFNAITGERSEDLISFDLSRQYLSEIRGYSSEAYNDYNRNQHHGPGTHSRTAATPELCGIGSQATSEHDRLMKNVTQLRSDDTIDDLKNNFERNHGDLFNSPYYDLATGLTEEEKAFYAELEGSRDVDLKALRLVKHVMKM